mgnify:CR=1 FL=1
MTEKNLSRNLNAAKKNKEDEFYTQLDDINKELQHYKKHFKNKIIYCNCDDPRISNFFKYFSLNFEHLELKKLVTTCYKNQDWNLFSMDQSESAVYLEYEGDKNNNKVPDPEEIGVHNLKGDGDFRSAEVSKLRDEADISCLDAEYVPSYDKKKDKWHAQMVKVTLRSELAVSCPSQTC